MSLYSKLFIFFSYKIKLGINVDRVRGCIEGHNESFQRKPEEKIPQLAARSLPSGWPPTAGLESPPPPTRKPARRKALADPFVRG